MIVPPSYQSPLLLPSDVWQLISNYLNNAESFQLGYTSTFHERLVFANNTARFEKLQIPRNMTEAGLESFLRRIDAIHVTKRLSLSDCFQLSTGEGLAPLHGSTVLEVVDLSNVAPSMVDRRQNSTMPPCYDDFLCSLFVARGSPIEILPFYGWVVSERMNELCRNFWLASNDMPSECRAHAACLSLSDCLYQLRSNGLPYCVQCQTWHCQICDRLNQCLSCNRSRCTSCSTNHRCRICLLCMDCQAVQGRDQICHEDSCCRHCAQQCGTCHEAYCPVHGLSCESCQMLLCETCHAACETCHAVLCVACRLEDGCDDCAPEEDEGDDSHHHQLDNFGYWAFHD